MEIKVKLVLEEKLSKLMNSMLLLVMVMQN